MNALNEIMKFFKYMFIFYILLYGVICDDDEDTVEVEDENGIEEVFQPTYEWQEVKKGQKIPQGLHVRVNLQSGVTEAKLLDENEASSATDSKKSALIQVNSGEENLDEIDRKLLEKPAIQHALHKMSNPPSSSSANDEILKPDDIKKIKDKFRSYEELKKDLGELNLSPKIDAEVLADLFNQYREEIEKKEEMEIGNILRIIEDLQFLGHQFDNALEFVKMNGFQEIIYKNFNLTTNSQVKRQTLTLLSSLLQNNPKVQIHALETGMVSTLLRMLANEEEIAVKNNVLTSLSCLLRRFPLAQQKFIENGGLSVISKVFSKPNLKLQVKVAILINDLLIERQNAFKYDYNKPQVINQYKQIKLEDLLMEHQWCYNLNELLRNLVAIDLNDHDSIEKCLLSMHVVVGRCGATFSMDVLRNLQTRYRILMNETAAVQDDNEDFASGDFFTNLYDLIGDILKTIENKSHNEL